MARALVVYESLWGNSEKVAREVAAGVGEVMPVEVFEVSGASTATSPTPTSSWPAARPTRSR